MKTIFKIILIIILFLFLFIFIEKNNDSKTVFMENERNGNHYKLIFSKEPLTIRTIKLKLTPFINNGYITKIYVNYDDEDKGISIVGVKKNSKEFYIIVDILNNKVYKNIENIYTKLENELSEYSNDVDINVCIAGEYTKKLKKAKISDILQKILYNMYAEKISDIEEENFLSVNAYSKLLKENNLKYLDREINLNIGIRYSEDDDKTMIYIATPIIKIDY